MLREFLVLMPCWGMSYLVGKDHTVGDHATGAAGGRALREGARARGRPVYSASLQVSSGS
jgi:hypothetical protein